MGFDVTLVDLYVVVLKTFGALLFEELQVVVVCEVAEGSFSFLWGISCCEGADVVNVHGDRPPVEGVFACEFIGEPEGA